MLTNRKKLLQGKIPAGDFKVTTPTNPLINNQAITSIRNLTNYPGLYPIGFDLVVAFFPFDAQTYNSWLILCTDPSKWLTTTIWTGVVGCKVLYFINNEDLEPLDCKTLWRTNVVASYRENKSLGLYIRIWRLLK